MGENSKIEWTDHTFNPWIGCTKISPACDHCYAERLGARLNVRWGVGLERRLTAESTWEHPLQWNRKAARAGTRARVFCASLADVFDNEAPQAWREKLFSLIEATPHLDWQLLTKRVTNVMRMVPADWDRGFPRNVWIGTSIGTRLEADRDLERLIQIPARVRFLSCEPLLERFELGLKGTVPKTISPRYALMGDFIHWVIVGGESGPRARRMDVEWAIELVKECREVGTPVFVKQLGANVVDRNDAGFEGASDDRWPAGTETLDESNEAYQGAPARILTRSRKGADMAEWPEALRIREFPNTGAM
jgi:protein gp37